LRDLAQEIRQMELVDIAIRNPAGESLERMVSNRVVVELQTVAHRPSVEKAH